MSTRDAGAQAPRGGGRYPRRSRRRGVAAGGDAAASGPPSVRLDVDASDSGRLSETDCSTSPSDSSPTSSSATGTAHSRSPPTSPLHPLFSWHSPGPASISADTTCPVAVCPQSAADGDGWPGTRTHVREAHVSTDVDAVVFAGLRLGGCPRCHKIFSLERSAAGHAALRAHTARCLDRPHPAAAAPVAHATGRPRAAETVGGARRPRTRRRAAPHASPPAPAGGTSTGTPAEPPPLIPCPVVG